MCLPVFAAHIPGILSLLHKAFRCENNDLFSRLLFGKLDDFNAFVLVHVFQYIKQVNGANTLAMKVRHYKML